MARRGKSVKKKEEKKERWRGDGPDAPRWAMDELNSISGAEAAGIAPIEVRRQQAILFRVCDVQPIPATIASFLFRSLPPGICNCAAGSCPPNGQPPLGGPYYCTGCTTGLSAYLPIPPSRATGPRIPEKRQTYFQQPQSVREERNTRNLSICHDRASEYQRSGLELS
ncbi:hypothetical protein BO79DRAFT_223979 [Aspergillus costaricaensis CBS 115574]|uniref:Uncharacterized protein n=1 Tax=Aspergillus costaricaensis CBS 115574 TaxID=1448317 RepID=A0ACD1ISK6_9EURO|nr:hypothetical protein BO79DRAFT_223979 [Aspergillus costaricaensis CBS 115574]RAK93507.1 hypothetical protein BO79DRAFT_223979 [Aspergillus costaricaensis CBS 115574]